LYCSFRTLAKAHRQEINLFGNPIKYEVRRSPDANEPRIDVDIQAVTVVIPEEEDVQPCELLKEHSAWVVDQQQWYDLPIILHSITVV